MTFTTSPRSGCVWCSYRDIASNLEFQGYFRCMEPARLTEPLRTKVALMVMTPSGTCSCCGFELTEACMFVDWEFGACRFVSVCEECNNAEVV